MNLLKMNHAIMDHKINNNHNDNDDGNENVDALSLRDLQMYDQTDTSSTRSSPRASPGQEPFEFFPTLSIPTEAGFEPRSTIWLRNTSPYKQVVPLKTPGSVYEGDDEELNDRCYHNGDYLKAIGSSSLRLHDRPMEHVVPLRSVSSRDIGSPRHGMKVSTSVKKVDKTVPTKSKRRMFMFGLVKFNPEMEMRSIKERQGRRAPSRMFPVANGGDGEFYIRSGSENTEDEQKPVVDGHKNTVTCRARLNSVFDKSIACLRI